MAQTLHWSKPWDKVLDWNPPFAKWFVGGQAQRLVQLRRPPLRRPDQEQGGDHLGGGTRRTAGCSATRTSRARSSQFANVLKGLGVGKGDVVAIYMPMVPELVIALLACARIGAPHTVVFGGFSAEALAGRIQDCQAKVLVTADGGYRRGKVVPLKENADGAAALCPTIEKPWSSTGAPATRSR